MGKKWVGTGAVLHSVVLIFGAVSICAQEKNQLAPPVPLHIASSLTELPVGPWGQYSRAHCGPCFLASRVQGQLFTFPIIVGQSRNLVSNVYSADSSSKSRTKSSRVAIHRRSSGLSPLLLMELDTPTSYSPRAVIQEADASGALWKYKIDFSETPVTNDDPPGTDANSKILPPSVWGKGEATVEYLPANVEPSSDGLLIRVTITNRSDKPQNYYTDVLSGMNGFNPAFELKELHVSLPKDASTVSIKHNRCPAVFSLLANAAPYAAHYYHVDDRYFTSLGEGEPLDTFGKAIPATSQESHSRQAGGVKASVPETDDAQRGSWGLLRVDDILLDPGQSATIYMSVGLGKDGESASENAQILLGNAEDLSPFGKSLREGLFTKAASLHTAARFHSGDSAIDQLMAQTLVNIPYALNRRVAVPTRLSTRSRTGGMYQPEGGGMTALAWSSYRPDWSAAQLNAWFLTQGDSSGINPYPRTELPTNLFALWELWQQTNDQALLTNFYPFAVKRHRELIRAAAVTGMPNLYGWLQGEPTYTSHRDRVETKLVGQPTIADPALTACIARSADILAAMASQLNRPAEEKLTFTQQRDSIIKELESKLWSERKDEYIQSGIKSTLPGTVAGLVPLMVSGYLLSSHKNSLLYIIKSESRFGSVEGIRTIDLSSNDNTLKSVKELPIELDYNWLIWKSLLDIGDTEYARQLSENLIKAFHQSCELSGGVPEFIGHNNTEVHTANDYTGENCALIALYNAYHNPGQVSSGWDTVILEHRFDAAQDTCHIVMRNLRPEGGGAVLCVMGKPKTSYLVSGALSGSYVSDQNGVIILISPKDSTTLTIDLKSGIPAAGPKS